SDSFQFEHRQSGRNRARTEPHFVDELVDVAWISAQRRIHRRLLGAEIRHVPRQLRTISRRGPDEIENVLNAGHRCRPLFEEVVRAGTIGAEDAAGDDTDVATLLEREVSGYQGAALFAGFHDYGGK